ncbi:MAG: gliding motility-associated C-terminal domain-containing protein [Chitinophagaceae bacterium]
MNRFNYILPIIVTTMLLLCQCLQAQNTCGISISSSRNSICSGDTVMLNASGGATYQWLQAASTLNDTTIANPLAFPQQTTTYLLRATTSNGCTAIDSITINVLPLPRLRVTNDTTICANSQITLTATGAATYVWRNATNTVISNSNIALVSPFNTERFTVTATASNGCIAKDTVTVTVTAPVNFRLQVSNNNICIGDYVTLRADGGERYQWLENGNAIPFNTTNTLRVAPNSTSIYRVIIGAPRCNIEDTLTTTVTVQRLPVASITKSNDIDCITNTARLTANGGIAYSWQPTTPNGSVIRNPSIQVQPPVTTTYYVEVMNSGGCTIRDSITVKVDFSIGESTFEVANAFTPNGDGLNDCFGLKYWGGVTALQFDIFNRWGQVVFSTQNPSNCWDGTLKGVKQPSGTYIYSIKAQSACKGTVIRKGNLVLIR